ncbi:MAG TPA: peptidylprolyl isomerase [Candidatus Acidoferrales bacterium]|nr:peptidylprolyl isomerase [Candidatus Acidoferrales bacterium]
MRSLALIALAAVLLGAVPATTTTTIVRLESERSLGDGRLAALLASPDDATAACAALAIGRTKLEAGVPLLEAHLSDPRNAVRAMSIYGLGLIGLGSDATEISAVLRDDVSGAVQVAAIDALGRYEEAHKLDAVAEKSAALALLRTLAGGNSPILRGRAAISLGSFSATPLADSIASSLMEAYADAPSMYRVSGNDFISGASAREQIMWTIFRYYTKDVPIGFLRSGLSDTDEIVRIEAVRAYGKLKDPALVTDLQPLLNDPSWRVQEQTAESIRVLQGGKMTEHWTSIPAFVHTPAPVVDPLAALPALPRYVPAPGAPRPQDVPEYSRSIAPQTALQMTTPDLGPHPRVRIVTTQGNIYVALYPEWAPLTVTNFLNMMNRGFLDNNPWFRIVPDFVVQTGEQDAKNAPGPGYSIPAEENPLEQNSYVISMGLNYDDKTSTPIRDSAGSEYYITLSPQYHLDNAFTVFGAVTGGFDVLGRLTESDKVIRVERIADVTL